MCSESIAESEPSYLTVAQLAQRLQVSESTIYGWVDRDYIPFLMAGDLSDLIRLQFTIGCQRKPIENVKETWAQHGTW